MPIYKTFATKKGTENKVIIEENHQNKAEFMEHLRQNGYHVNESRVKTKAVFDHIVSRSTIREGHWRMPERTYIRKYMKNGGI